MRERVTNIDISELEKAKKLVVVIIIAPFIDGFILNHQKSIRYHSQKLCRGSCDTFSRAASGEHQTCSLDLCQVCVRQSGSI